MALEQAPEGAGVALHTVVCGNHEDRVVKGREGPLGLGAKVHVARRIHQREAGTGVLELGLGRKDGDAAVSLHASVSRWESPRSTRPRRRMRPAS